MKKGFDNEKYVKKQKEEITKRIERFDNKLYLEFGGKLFDDYHASRVLPGFDVNCKIKLLQAFKDKAEIIFCINAADIEKNKIRADFGITYDLDVLRTIDNIRDMGLYINSVVITQYKGQPSANVFRKKLERHGIKSYLHYPIDGYPSNVDLIVSDEGYGKNDFVKTTKPLVVVTAPGPCSGKMATCLSQMYHEAKHGVKAGYAKFETFPVWNLPLKHPVNIAYEAATADLKDINMIDPFHLEQYGITTVNYNRDVEVFPIVKNILNKLMGKEIYHSPTDMGVNMVAHGIVDDDAVREAGKQEIIRRYFKYWCDYKQGTMDIETPQRVEVMMKQLDITPEDRAVVAPAHEKSKESGSPAMSIELNDGTIVTGHSTDLMNAPSSTLLNAVKQLSGVNDDILLLSPVVLEPIIHLKKDVLNGKQPKLNLEEVLIAMSICAATNPMVERAMSKVSELCGCEAHSTHILSQTDEKVLRKLNINLTSDPNFPTKELYYV